MRVPVPEGVDDVSAKKPMVLKLKMPIYWLKQSGQSFGAPIQYIMRHGGTHKFQQLKGFGPVVLVFCIGHSHRIWMPRGITMEIICLPLRKGFGLTIAGFRSWQGDYTTYSPLIQVIQGAK